MIFCDLCPEGKRATAIFSCIVCNRDCCESHTGDELPKIHVARHRTNQDRKACTDCCKAIQIPPRIPQDLFDAMSRWQDQIAEQTRAKIAEQALQKSPSEDPPQSPMMSSTEEVLKEFIRQKRAAEAIVGGKWSGT